MSSPSAWTNGSWLPRSKKNSAGVAYQFDKHWSAGFSASCLQFGTKANLTTRLPNGGAVKSVAKITLDPLVMLVSVNYRF